MTASVTRALALSALGLAALVIACGGAEEERLTGEQLALLQPHISRDLWLMSLAVPEGAELARLFEGEADWWTLALPSDAVPRTLDARIETAGAAVARFVVQDHGSEQGARDAFEADVAPEAERAADIPHAVIERNADGHRISVARGPFLVVATVDETRDAEAVRDAIVLALGDLIEAGFVPPEPPPNLLAGRSVLSDVLEPAREWVASDGGVEAASDIQAYCRVGRRAGAARWLFLAQPCLLLLHEDTSMRPAGLAALEDAVAAFDEALGPEAPGR